MLDESALSFFVGLIKLAYIDAMIHNCCRCLCVYLPIAERKLWTTSM